MEKSNEIMSHHDLINLKYSLKYSDLNINYSSTISLEAILLDKPVINYIEPSMPIFDYDHYRPLVDSGAVKLVKRNNEAMAKAITDYLTNPSLDRTNRLNLAKLYFPSRDGLAYKRNADFVDKIINENR